MLPIIVVSSCGSRILTLGAAFPWPVKKHSPVSISYSLPYKSENIGTSIQISDSVISENVSWTRVPSPAGITPPEKSNASTTPNPEALS